MNSRLGSTQNIIIRNKYMYMYIVNTENPNHIYVYFLPADVYGI